MLPGCVMVSTQRDFCYNTHTFQVGMLCNDGIDMELQ